MSVKREYHERQKRLSLLRKLCGQGCPRSNRCPRSGVIPVTFLRNFPLSHDKPMTIEILRILEFPRARPTGHRQSETRGAREDARGAQRRRVADMFAPDSLFARER